MTDEGTALEARLEAQRRMLASVNDLKEQIERGELLSMAYAAVGGDGSHVVTSVSNGMIAPITLLGAIVSVEARVQAMILSISLNVDDDGAAPN